MSYRPLSGLCIVEAGRDVALRYCGRLFAQLGATVVRAPGGDDHAIGYSGEAGVAYGRWLDQGKQTAVSSPVDLVLAGQYPSDVAAGQALADGLAGAPSMLALTWFHADGPYGDWRGTDEVILALTGVAYPFGEAPGPPTLAQGHGPQVAAGVVAFNAALGALIADPRPKRVEVNVFEAFMCLTETGAISALMEGGASVRLGVNRFVPTYPCSSYRTADGWVGVTALTPAQWKALCGLIDRPHLALDPRFTTAVERLLLGDEIDALVAPPFLERDTDDWVRLGESARVPITPMPNLRELPHVPHWRDRGCFGTFDASGIRAPTLPWRATTQGPLRSFARGGAAAPLDGLRVIDFSMGWAGPLCTRTLADLGADVIKIESESHPDWWRGWETDQSGDPPPRETKFSFISVNRNKRGVTLDLLSPDGLAQARALIAGADVVVENFAAGVMEKLGLGPAARRALNPGLIAVSMAAFGNGGPLSGIRAYGSTVEQASGLPFANGHDTWPPSLQHVAYGDPIAGLYAAAAVLAAVAGRGRDGGAEIDLAQVACLFQFGADAIIAQQFHGEPLDRTGSCRPRAAPVCVLAGSVDDSWLAIAVDGGDAWRALAAHIGFERGITDPDLADVAGRRRHASVVEAALEGWSITRDPTSAAALLQALGVPAAPVQRVDSLGYDPQLIAGGFWTELDRRYVGRHLTAAAPFSYDGKRPLLRRSAPTLGEHTAEVLKQAGASPSDGMGR